MQEAVPGMTLSFDTTNLAAIEAGLKKIGSNSIINSTSAEEERLANVPPLAARYGSKLIALCMEKSGIPVSADARVAIAMEKLIPRAQEVGMPDGQPARRSADPDSFRLPGVRSAGD